MANPDRLLALNIRAARIGYVLFDGPERLMDWGTHTMPTGTGREICVKRIGSLVTLTAPSDIVICTARQKRDVDIGDAIEIAAFIQGEAALRSITFRSIGARGIQEIFHALGAANKYEGAAVAPRAYPEILWKLPPMRKRWQTEPRVMLIFDALIAGLAYWRRCGHQIPGLDNEQRSGSIGA